MLKHPGIFCILFLACISVSAQSSDPYEFKEYKRHAATPVKSQDQTGTCWAFSTASFLESEALRAGKGEADFSEMWVVRHIYRMKCENYVRRQGHAQFGEGGLAHDYLNAIKRYGVVPENVYPGRKDPSKPFNHGQLVKNLADKCKEFAEQGKKGELDPSWLSQIDAILDAEFGPVTNKFAYNNGVYSPLSYREFMGINPDQYVTITSFTHQPFWEKFILEIPDNWSNGEFYNMPINEMMRCAQSALEKGYTLEWDADVSNGGFSANNGIAIVPKTPWEKKSTAERSNSFKMVEPQVDVTQEYRQELFDSQETMDDHLMHIVGLLDEKNSGTYYVVKNSWGPISQYKGYVYVSDAYMRLNTISFTLPKEAIPEDIRIKLGLLTSAKPEKAQPQPQKAAPAPTKTTPSGRSNPAPSTIQMRPTKKQ
ncbi:MAG: aminopeptidase [Saprospiraceae bacterium]|nr:aminopeptidase [Saprospiraceae bacterium]